MEDSAQNYSIFNYPNRDVSKVLKIVFLVIPFAALATGIANILLGRYLIAALPFAFLVLCLISYLLVHRNRLELAAYLALAGAALAVTGVSILGLGIHEPSIITFPVIVLFSSFILRGKGVVISTLFVIACLAVVSCCELFGFPAYDSVPPGRVEDILAVSAILLVNILILNYLSSFTKRSLESALEEVSEQQKIEEQIADNLSAKSQLLTQAHHRVKNTLSLLNSLVDLEITTSQSSRNDLKHLQQKIQAVARVHDPLFQSLDYRKVDAKEYAERLIFGFSSSFKIPDYLLDISIEPRKLEIEKVIPLGIILHELMSLYQSDNKSPLSIQLTFEARASSLLFEDQAGRMELDKNVAENDLIELMVEEMNASIQSTKNRIVLEFDSLS